MASAEVVETSVSVTSNSPSQDYTHPDDHNLRTYDKLQDCVKYSSLFKKDCFQPIEINKEHRDLADFPRMAMLPLPPFEAGTRFHALYTN